ncbi:MAG TPA: hypothetical protein VK400_13400 [Pyrinomonadaceae bacterium]|nr:hypothetical protein [Pyrinomonadaceae bacterium]
MRISRWIYFPLYLVAAYVLLHFLFDKSITADWLLYYAILGAVVGFGTMLWNDAVARKVTGRNDKEIYIVRQRRNLTLLLNYQKAFECCREAVNELNPAKIKEESPESGVIKFRTRMNWHSFGDIITINLKKINENLTEIEIRTRPIPRTILSGAGDSWKHVEDICNYLKERDVEINKKLLVESAQILDEVYVKPFQKEKIQL